MKRAIIAFPAIALSACSPTPDDSLLEIASQMNKSAQDCVREVNLGSQLLGSDDCKDFVKNNNRFLSEIRSREADYEDSFEYEIRDIVNRPRGPGYFSCSGQCWKARTHAVGASALFQFAIMRNLGCRGSSLYFSIGSFEDFEASPEDEPCKRTSQPSI